MASKTGDQVVTLGAPKLDAGPARPRGGSAAVLTMSGRGGSGVEPMGHNLSAWAVRHRPLVLFLILVVAIAGALSFQRLGRAEDPNFAIKMAIVTAVWPGATAREMQEQVADRIEKKFQELPYFDKVTTYTKPAFTAMQVGFRDNTPPKELPALFYQIRKKLDDIRGELPAGLIGPSVNDEYGDVDSVLYMLTGVGADYAKLKKVAEGLRQRLLKIGTVAKVNLYGVQEERIFVEFSHAKLATLGVTPQTLFDSLARQNAVAPARHVETGASACRCASRAPSMARAPSAKRPSRRGAPSGSATSRR
jgi:multidrug efflux pump subunit AcrB